MQKEEFITIIIPVRNAERTMNTTFEYLLNVDYPRDKMEIIMADGDSTDSTVKIIEEWQTKYDFIKLVQVKNCKSPGEARNAALKVTKGTYVLFTDGDCAPNKDWVKKIIAPFSADPKVGIVGGEVLTLRTDQNNLTESYCEQVHFLSPTGRCGITSNGYMPKVKNNYPHEINGGDNSPFFATANVAARKEAIDKMGGQFWNEPTGEDVDFNLQIQFAGYSLFYAKDAIVKHMHRVSTALFMKQYHGYGFGHPLLIQKHAKPNVLEIVIQIGKGIHIPLPWFGKGIIHIGNFHLMHIFPLATLINFLLVKFAVVDNNLTIWFGGLSIFFILAYFRSVLKIKPLISFLSFAKVRYLSNYAFIKGAWQGMKKFGTICIEPSW
jgi:cellulose synthase/poly-beta-1,6-N-acetylglucosamine synthase-like glycosyltransferase